MTEEQMIYTAAVMYFRGLGRKPRDGDAEHLYDQIMEALGRVETEFG